MKDVFAYIIGLGASALEAAGAKVLRTSSKECDFSDRNAVCSFIEKIKREHQIDILINNAGTILPVDGGWLAR